MRLSIVLPCYNEARNLPLILEGYREIWEDLPAELILVDNGSTDGTAELLDALLSHPEYAFARVVRVGRNQGYGHGIHTGLLVARGEYVGFSHADMQCAPVDLFRAYRALQASPDPRECLVKGRRGRRGWQASLITSGMSALASLLFCTPLTDINAQPKVFHRSHLQWLNAPPDGFQYDVYVLLAARRHNIESRTIPVQFASRAHGESKWAFSFLSRWRTILAMIRYLFRLRFGLAA